MSRVGVECPFAKMETPLNPKFVNPRLNAWAKGAVT